MRLEQARSDSFTKKLLHFGDQDSITHEDQSIYMVFLSHLGEGQPSRAYYLVPHTYKSAVCSQEQGAHRGYGTQHVSHYHTSLNNSYSVGVVYDATLTLAQKKFAKQLPPR